MPCNSDGYSEPRAMEPDEAWRSLSRHHRATEIELEALRKYCDGLESLLRKIKEIVPGVTTTPKQSRPRETPEWRGITYRDKNGKWPNDIRRHIDWLSDNDFQQG